MWQALFTVFVFVGIKPAYSNTEPLSLTVQSEHPLPQDTYRLGKKVYSRCVACHGFAYHRTGPKHCGLKDRKAGSLKSYRYSEAMKQSGIIWDEETLNKFLQSPRTMVPGTTMGYAGIKKDKERQALIAYLLEESVSDERCGHE